MKDIYTAAKVRFLTSLRALVVSLILRQVPIEWEEVSVTPIFKGGKTVIPESAITSVKKNTVALKGALLATSVRDGFLTDLRCRPARYPQCVFLTLECILIPTRISSWQGARIPEPHAAPYLQSLCQRAAVRFHQGLQDALR